MPLPVRSCLSRIRRTRTSLATLFGFGAALIMTIPASARDCRAAEGLGFNLSLQCWTFNRMCTFEVIDYAKAHGIKFLEIYPGQKMRRDAAVKIGPEMSAEERTELKAKLTEAGVTVVNFGVVGLGGDEAANRRVFEFAKELGIQTINSEPPPQHLPGIARLAEEYGVNVALHNHPTPSRYWNPEVAYTAIKDLNARMGLCADTGHWSRSGVDPVEAVQKYGDRIKTFHFKDLNEFGAKKAHDVPWGTGACKPAEVLAELKRQGFKGAFSIEYEHRPKNQQALVAECVTNFDQLCADVVEADVVRPKELIELFNGKDLSGWTGDALNDVKRDDLWSVEDGVIRCKGNPKGVLRTEKVYADYKLTVEWRWPGKGGNSGVLIHCSTPRRLNIWPQSIESQLASGHAGDFWEIGESVEVENSKARTKGRRRINLTDGSEKAEGEWNTKVVLCRGNTIEVYVNGTLVNKGSKMSAASGAICVQSEGTPVEFRKITVEPLP